MKHTPGPWTAELDAHGRGRIKGDRCWVATTWTTADDDSNKRYPAEANALLIASAPDLLEALTKLLDMHDRCDAGFAPTVELRFAIRDMARAAIAKATGEQP